MLRTTHCLVSNLWKVEHRARVRSQEKQPSCHNHACCGSSEFRRDSQDGRSSGGYQAGGGARRGVRREVSQARQATDMPYMRKTVDTFINKEVGLWASYQTKTASLGSS
ncbi:uncharacterized protein LOC123515851 [Portunus trituberculatus]|uniref:uncharacterized protein LOC123515851 n=1 Tax=Portunus trituberculatus TaxID=210409 RepID=UPI001E1CBCC3|nr:uncharacterized protein LOC123515851 [Portunus trituberculatus]